MYNRESLDLFAQYIRVRGSRQKSSWGRPLPEDTISRYVEELRLLRSREAGYDVAPPGETKLRTKLVNKLWRRQAKRYRVLGTNSTLRQKLQSQY